MKVAKAKTLFRRLQNRDYFLLFPDGSPKGFWVDLIYLKELVKIRWRYIAKNNRARGYFGRTKTRQYLHRYVLTLAKKYYPEVTFGNGDMFDCRLVNLKPYRREEEGAMRCKFKNNTSQRKGVCFHRRAKRWVAMIRVRGKLRHLGYFRTADEAAREYAKAWNLAHPTLAPVPVGV